MVAAAYGTFSDIEILWTLLAAVGLSFSIFNVIDARKELSWAKSVDGKNGRVVLGRWNLIAEHMRAAKQVIFLLIGILAMFYPENPPQDNLTLLQEVTGFMLRWGLITASALTMGQSYIGWKARRDLKRDNIPPK